MKKIILAVICLLTANCSFAQWVQFKSVTQTRDAFNNWQNAFSDSAFVFNDDCLATSISTRKWDTSLNEWGNYIQATNTYNSDNTENSHLQQDWTGSGWINNLQINWAYDGSGHAVNEIIQDWNTATSAWDNYEKELFENNADGTLHITHYLAWNTTGMTWDTTERSTCFYNAAGGVDTILYEIYTSGTWKNVNLYTYTFNADHQRASQLNQDWNTAASSWDSIQLQVYIPYLSTIFYTSSYVENWNAATTAWDTIIQNSFTYTPCTAAAVAQVTTDKNIDIFPNPSLGDVNVQLSAPPVPNTVLTITNTLGQKLRDCPLTGQQTALHLDLPAGIYFMTVANETGSVSKKLIVE